MARLVLHERNQPYVVQEGKFPLYLCACGLSKSKPYCDGSHKRAGDEEAGTVYVYDESGRAASKPAY